MTLEAFNGPRNQSLATPWPWVRRVERALGRTFDLDVCAEDATAKAPRHYTVDDDGLVSPWEGLCWCNPPFDDIARWVGRGLEQYHGRPRCIGVVFCVPVRSETSWFQRLRIEERRGDAFLAFPPERISYEGSSGSPYFASCFWAVGPAWMSSIRQLEGSPVPDLFSGAAS